MTEFVVRGTRGTVSASGLQYIKYGGHTTCFSITTDKGIIIIDAGTGISNLVAELTRISILPEITILFTHFHLDHLMGLPSFDLLYEPRTKITLMADSHRKEDWRTTICVFVNEPFWPVGFVDLYAMTHLRDLPADVNSMEVYGIQVSWIQVPHPQQCLAFRFDMPDRSVVIATDTEFHPRLVSPDFLQFCKGTETLVFDAQYTPQEYTRRVGWGHSSWEVAVSIASKLDVGKLVLTHHDPRRKDKEIDEIVEEANRLFPRTVAAVENMKI